MRSRSSGGAACGCESPALAYGAGRKSQRRGVKAWERTIAKDFKLEPTGVPGRLPVGPDGVQESAIDGVAAAVDDGRAGHIKIPSLGQSHGRQAMGSGRYSCLGDTECRAESQGCQSARVESRVSSRCGRRRVVDDGCAGHMEHTVARPVSWEAVGRQRTGLSLGRRDAQGGRPVRPAGPSGVKSSVSRVVVERAVDDGRARHMGKYRR